MGIAHRLNSLAHDLLTPISVSKADIREELECHMELRVMKNISAGMSEEEARLDAEKRFGNFEHSVEDCYRASMGIRVWLTYCQRALFVTLAGAVLWLSTSMFQMQSDYESEITDLRERLASKKVAAVPNVGAAEKNDNAMKIRQWNFPVSKPLKTPPMPITVAHFENNPSVSPDEAWCDWSVLDLDQNQ